MVTALFANDTVNMDAIGGDEAADIIAGEEENALDAVSLLGVEGETTLALKEGVGGPSGTPEDTGGVVGGGHGVKVLVELGGGDLLSLVNGEKQVSNGTDNLGARAARVELNASFAQLINQTGAGFPASTRTNTGIEGKPDATHVVSGLGSISGGDGDNPAAFGSVTEEKPGENVSLELVLTGLTGKDNDKGETQMVDDGILDGRRNAALVGAEVYAGGGSPGDGIMADGLTDTEGEGRGGGRIKHEGLQDFKGKD
jgi:hypothetical protein